MDNLNIFLYGSIEFSEDLKKNFKIKNIDNLKETFDENFSNVFVINFEDKIDIKLTKFINDNYNKFAFLILTHQNNQQFFRNINSSVIYEKLVLPINYEEFLIKCKYLDLKVVSEQNKFSLDDKLFKEICEKSSVGITVSNPNKEKNSLIYLNPKFEEITGYSKNEIINLDCSYLYGTLTEPDKIKKLKEAMKNEQECKVIFKNYKKDGTVFYNEIETVPVFDENKKLKYFVSNHQDVTELYEYKTSLENKIVEQIEQIRQKDTELLEIIKQKSADELLRNISHQWKQPLNVISLSASSLLSDKMLGLLEEENLEIYAKNILDSTTYLSTLINKFSSYFDSENNNYQDISLQVEISKALDVVSDTIKDAKIDLQVNMEQVSLQKKLKLGALTEVVLELLNNSIDVLNERKIENPWIKLDLKVIDYDICISVEDNAGGIQGYDDINDIFLPYITTKHKAVGVGLSLHYVQRVVKYTLNGFLGVKNSENGAKFTVKIGNFNQLKNLKVIYVEDNTEQRTIFGRLLKNYVSDIVVCKNGQEALETFREDSQSYDLIISDLMMPKLDGLSLIKKVKESNPNISAIITSAYLNEDNIEDIKKIGVDEYFNKPTELNVIINRIKELLNAK